MKWSKVCNFLFPHWLYVLLFVVLAIGKALDQYTTAMGWGLTAIETLPDGSQIFHKLYEMSPTLNYLAETMGLEWMHFIGFLLGISTYFVAVIMRKLAFMALIKYSANPVFFLAMDIICLAIPLINIFQCFYAVTNNIARIAEFARYN